MSGTGPSTPAAPPPTPGPTGPSVLLVGVAHVLDLESALERVLSDYAPKALAVELDPQRAELLAERVRSRDAPEAEKEEGGPEGKGSRGGAPFLLQMWAKLQERFASELGGLPGEEMLQAGHYAKRHALPCFLVDDPIQQISARLLSSLSVQERVRLVMSTLIALFIPTRVIEHEIQEYSAQPEGYVDVLRTQYPTVARVLLDERNEHMAGRIRTLASSFGRLAAVVGDAHVLGLAQLLEKQGVRVTSVPLGSLTSGTSPVPPPRAG